MALRQLRQDKLTAPSHTEAVTELSQMLTNGEVNSLSEAEGEILLIVLAIIEGIHPISFHILQLSETFQGSTEENLVRFFTEINLKLKAFGYGFHLRRTADSDISISFVQEAGKIDLSEPMFTRPDYLVKRPEGGSAGIILARRPAPEAPDRKTASARPKAKPSSLGPDPPEARFDSAHANYTEMPSVHVKGSELRALPGAWVSAHPYKQDPHIGWFDHEVLRLYFGQRARAAQERLAKTDKKGPAKARAQAREEERRRNLNQGPTNSRVT